MYHSISFNKSQPSVAARHFTKLFFCFPPLTPILLVILIFLPLLWLVELVFFLTKLRSQHFRISQYNTFKLTISLDCSVDSLYCNTLIDLFQMQIVNKGSKLYIQMDAFYTQFQKNLSFTCETKDRCMDIYETSYDSKSRNFDFLHIISNLTRLNKWIFDSMSLG